MSDSIEKTIDSLFDYDEVASQDHAVDKLIALRAILDEYSTETKNLWARLYFLQMKTDR